MASSGAPTSPVSVAYLSGFVLRCEERRVSCLGGLYSVVKNMWVTYSLISTQRHKFRAKFLNMVSSDHQRRCSSLIVGYQMDSIELSDFTGPNSRLRRFPLRLDHMPRLASAVYLKRDELRKVHIAPAQVESEAEAWRRRIIRPEATIPSYIPLQKVLRAKAQELGTQGISTLLAQHPTRCLTQVTCSTQNRRRPHL